MKEMPEIKTGMIIEIINGVKGLVIRDVEAIYGNGYKSMPIVLFDDGDWDYLDIHTEVEIVAIYNPGLIWNIHPMNFKKVSDKEWKETEIWRKKEDLKRGDCVVHLEEIKDGKSGVYIVVAVDKDEDNNILYNIIDPFTGCRAYDKPMPLYELNQEANGVYEIIEKERLVEFIQESI